MKKPSVSIAASKMALRFFGYHIMCLFVSLSVAAFMTGVAGLIVSQFCCLVIIYVMPYLSMYKLGFEDCNRINTGRMQKDKLFGLKVAYMGYSPFILLSVACVLAKFGAIPSGYVAFYRLFNAPFMSLMQSVLPTSLTVAEYPVRHVLAVAALSLSVPLSPALGYAMGLERISFTEEYVHKHKRQS